MSPAFSDSTVSASVLGVLLAGGGSRRMGGGNKSLLPWNGTTLLEAVAARARPQVGQLIISGSPPPDVAARLKLPVVMDEMVGSDGQCLGPLAGIVSAMRWSRRKKHAHRWLATFAADTPLLPADYVARCLASAHISGCQVVCAASGGRTHYTFSLWRMDLLHELESSLAEGDRALRNIVARSNAGMAVFDNREADPFFNINTPQDWEMAQRYTARAGK